MIHMFTQHVPFEELRVLSTLALRVRRERVRQGLTQPAVANAAGVTLRTYKRFEKSGRGSAETLMRVAYALGRGPAAELLFPSAQTREPAFAARIQRLRELAEARQQRSIQWGHGVAPPSATD